MKEILHLLKRMEWRGMTRGQPTYMGTNDGPMLRCCPMCGGIDPSSPLKNHFTKSAHGHRDTCDLSIHIRRLEEEHEPK